MLGKIFNFCLIIVDGSFFHLSSSRRSILEFDLGNAIQLIQLHVVLAFQKVSLEYTEVEPSHRLTVPSSQED